MYLREMRGRTGIFALEAMNNVAEVSEEGVAITQTVLKINHHFFLKS